MEIVDVTESDVDLQSVLLHPVVWSEKVCLVGLGRRLVAGDLDQLGRFDQHWEFSVACSYSYRLAIRSVLGQILLEM